ncbi:NAD(P)-binding domain-containing protein [Streptacidiphilus sp. N1-3]|uniref:NAD(P)-binding domain-containing protein n=1 Tax=Streptacidiphilus alkalitolerans TaxID=3342712 RepID=A0ABV6XE24_9ACTN
MTDRILDCLVIGAGPAGLQLGRLLHEQGRDYLILEEGSVPGSFFTVYPRHRRLISINKPHTGSRDPEFNLRMDWNSLLSPDPELLFTRYSERYFPDADDMVRYLADFADRFALHVRYGSRVTEVGREGEDACFTVGDERGQRYRARRVVVATGVSRPYVPEIPGIEHAEQYATVSVRPGDFTDQRVLIIGKGNSALETADNLVETAAVIHVAGPHSLRLAWQSHFVGHLRAVNNNFLDTYQLKSQNAVLDGTVQRIERQGDGYLVRFSFSRADEVVKELRYDRVIACTGFRFDASVFADGARPRLVINDRFPELTSAYESVNVPGLHFAGTLTQQRDFKVSTSGFIHGFRYGTRALHRILEQRHHDRPWPSRELPVKAGDLAEAVVERVNRTSALWQQFGVMADVLVVDGGSARYYEEVPVGYVHEGLVEPGDADVFTVTLEYGPDHDKVDPFDISVRRVAQDAVGTAHDAAYLHPVVRHYRRGVLRATHHLAENLENEWSSADVHVAPLRAFLAGAARASVD